MMASQCRPGVWPAKFLKALDSKPFIMPAKITGEKAPPQRESIQRIPPNQARDCTGNHLDCTLAMAGNAPASPTPKMKRYIKRETKPVAAPESAVKRDQARTMRASALRAPYRSASQPPGISKR